MISFNDVAGIIKSRNARLIAIDGIPCSGKSTLAAQLAKDHGYTIFAYDDFCRPVAEWKDHLEPQFPMACFRHDAFLDCIRQLASTGTCSYLPFDWEKMEISSHPRTITTLQGPVIVEGFSVLDERIAALYDLRFLVHSDRATTLEAVYQRDGRAFEDYWERVWMPGADLYMQTQPEKRADFIVAGRLT